MEYYIKYWQDCSNKCDFCTQIIETSLNNWGKFILPSKESLIKHNAMLLTDVKEYVKNFDDGCSEVHIAFIGGELFHRADMTELYDGFTDTINTLRQIKDILSQYNKKLYVRIFSNLLYEDLSLFKHVINQTTDFPEINWRTSFDLKGRIKSNDRLLLYVKNINEIKDLLEKTGRLIKIKSVITKETILELDKSSNMFKSFFELTKRFKMVFHKFEILDDNSSCPDEIRERFWISDEEFIGFVLATFPHLNARISSNILGPEDLCTIENCTRSITNHITRRDLKKILCSL